jgi:STE24 endopeptidase
MVGSFLLLLVLLSWMGQFEGIALVGWIVSGAALCSRAGERVAVRLGEGFRQPTRDQSAVIAPAWSVALRRCGLAASDVDLYVRPDGSPNAFAAGGRSVAITTGALVKFMRSRLETST